MTQRHGIDLTDVLNELAFSIEDRLYTSLPAVVIAYDSASQTASVKPVVKKVLWDQDDQPVYEEYPTIPGVPVCFPRGGGFFISFPVTAGDHVMLVFSKQSFADWRTTGELSEPRDKRLHGFGNAVAIPGVFPRAGKTKDASGTKAIFGRDDSEQQISIDGANISLGKTGTVPVVLMPGFASFLGALNTFATAVNTFAVAATTLPAIISAAPALAAAATAMSAAATAATTSTPSTIVKAK